MFQSPMVSNELAWLMLVFIQRLPLNFQLTENIQEE